ncbi:hypothetical protein FKM82_024731 [Ascaphus truei]
MLFHVAVTLALLLHGRPCGGDFLARVHMVGVKGSVSVSTDSQTISANLSGICEDVNISLHEFPVTYGASRDSCHPRNIGPSSYRLRLNGTGLLQGHFQLRLGCSLVVETCGHRACANLHDTSGPLHTWRAFFRSFVVGHAYFLRVSDLHPLTALTELALLEGSPVSAASLYFSNSCHTDGKQLLGIVEVGNRLEAARNRTELSVTTVMPFVLLQYRGQWACAEVRALRSKEASSQFGMQGVNGSFVFRQESPFHPTQVEINLWNLGGLAGHYGIHSLPVPPRQESCEDLCSDVGTGELWNPLGVNRSSSNYPARFGSTHDQWELGSLSGRHGSLDGHQELQTTLTDWNLPLYGTSSIIGRSVVLFKRDNSPWVCSTIHQKGEVVTVLASFHKGLLGRVMFRQPLEDPNDDLSILVELSPISGITTRGHNWHVHELPLQTHAENCASTRGHFNPHSVPTGGNYSQECKASNPLLCEAGDYAGRHIPIILTSPTLARYLFTDTSSSLSGADSIVGKSLVIHGAESAMSRIACANLILLTPKQGKTSSWLGSGDALGELKASQTSDLDPTSIRITFQGLKGRAGGFHIHQLPVSWGSVDPCSDARIKGHFNPFGVKMSASPAVRNGTDDQYEVGDISGRRGSLVGRDQMTIQFTDLNFPLSGMHSTLGRSLVIHYTNGSR